jgi:hypothetical protein
VISKCANPKCDVKFHYSHEGRLFAYEIRNPKEPCRDVPGVICKKKPKRAAVYFWLCGRCCRLLTLHFTISAGMTLVSNQSEEIADQNTGPTPRVLREHGGFVRRYA